MIAPADGAGRSVISDSAETFLLKVLLSIVGFAAGVLISRGLGPAGRGEYYLPVIAAGTIVVLCKLGVEQANVFLYATRGLAIDRLARQSALVGLVMGLLGWAVLLQAPRALPRVFAGTPILLLLLAGLTIPLAVHAQLAAGLLTLGGRVTWQFRVALLAAVVQAVLLLGLWSRGTFTVGAVFGVYVVTAVLTWALTVGRLAGGLGLLWDVRLLRETLSHSLLLHLGMVLFFLHLRLDMFMVTGMIGATALGYYSLSVMLAETVLLPTDSLAIAILPRQLGNTVEEAAATALRGARANGLIGLTAAALWALLGWPLIRVFFGAAFAPAFLPLLGLLPGMVFLGMQRVCGGPVVRAGRPGQMAFIYAVSLIGNIALNLWWIPSWGPLGAALSSSVSYGLSAGLFLLWTSRLAKAPFSDGIVPRMSDWLVLRRATREGMVLLSSLYHDPRKQVP